MKANTIIKTLIVLIGIAVALAIGLSIASNTSTAYNQADITAPNGTVHVTIATTTDDQEKGLGDRASLPEGTGMLFSFTQPGTYGFWMKDMHFDLDMIWINTDKSVAGISSDVPANSYPNIFLPPNAISYVLEVNAGDAARFGIATGTILKF